MNEVFSGLIVDLVLYLFPGDSWEGRMLVAAVVVLGWVGTRMYWGRRKTLGTCLQCGASAVTKPHKRRWRRR